MPSQVELAYLAGLFDGEGTVGIYESWSVQRGKRRSIWIYQAQIANCSIKVLTHVADLVGGTIAKKSKGKSHWRQGYVWRSCGDDAANFMRMIREFSIVKRDEIDEALRFREVCLPRRHLQTADQIEEKRSVVLKLKELKRAI